MRRCILNLRITEFIVYRWDKKERAVSQSKDHIRSLLYVDDTIDPKKEKNGQKKTNIALAFFRRDHRAKKTKFCKNK